MNAARLLGVALLFPGLAAAAGPADRLLAAAAAGCAALDGGVMTVPEEALVRVDLSGDGTPDALLDESRLDCSTAASAFQGSGGAMLHAVGARRSPAGRRPAGGSSTGTRTGCS